MELTPLSDGVTHINVYSKGKTELGRLLTNPSPLSFTHPYFGRFETVEGFHFFLKTGMQNYDYAKLSGFDARKYGKEDHRNYVNNPDFDRMMRIAWICKITQNSNLCRLVMDNDLPLTHYYFYGREDNCKIIPVKGNFVEKLTEVCNFLKSNG